MQTGLNVALSGQIVLQRKLETIAHNLANASTPGFRAREVTFESIMAQTGDTKTAFSASGGEYTSLRSGGLLSGGEGDLTDGVKNVAVGGGYWNWSPT
jgi:flagellar basal-body rod protein FlgF